MHRSVGPRRIHHVRGEINLDGPLNQITPEFTAIAQHNHQINIYG